jgi:hypothetical protein
MRGTFDFRLRQLSALLKCALHFYRQAAAFFVHQKFDQIITRENF